MKNFTLPVPGSKSRFVIVAYGLVILVWLGLEDNSTISVAVLGSGLALMGCLFWILNRFEGQSFSARHWLTGIIIFGAVSGTLSAISTTVLMFFKSSWHSHQFFDYPPQMMLAMLSRVPVWAVAGALIGLALGLLQIGFAHNATSSKCQTSGNGS